MYGVGNTKIVIDLINIVHHCKAQFELFRKEGSTSFTRYVPQLGIVSVCMSLCRLESTFDIAEDTGTDNWVLFLCVLYL